MKKLQEIKLHINPNLINEAKNADGSLGEKCNNCGGFGFTMSIGSGKLGCKDCEQTGVKLLSLKDLQDQMNDMKKDLKGLKEALVSTLAINGLTLKVQVHRSIQLQRKRLYSLT